MTLSPPLDPAQTFDCILPQHDALPPTERPILTHRYNTCRQWMAFDERYRIGAASAFPGGVDDLASIVLDGAVMLRRGDQVWTGANLKDGLLECYSPAGLHCLIDELSECAALSEIQAKKSARQSRSGAAPSVATAISTPGTPPSAV